MKGRIIVVLVGVLNATVFLSACDGSNTSTGAERQLVSLVEPNYTISPFVQNVMKMSFPADGEVHILSRGKFAIDADTYDCVIPISINPALEETAPGFYGVGPGRHIVFGQKSQDGHTLCIDDGTNQVSHLSLDLNQQRKPYKLTLAVWQGDVAWVGTIGRTADNLSPNAEYAHPIDGGDVPIKVRIEGNIRADLRKLENVFSSMDFGAAK